MAVITPLGNRILVQLLPRYEGEESKLNLTLVDKQRHYEGVRRGVVKAVADGVVSVKKGDIVLFLGDSGDSFGMTELGCDDGTDWRRLRVSDILAVEEPEVLEAV